MRQYITLNHQFVNIGTKKMKPVQHFSWTGFKLIIIKEYYSTSARIALAGTASPTSTTICLTVPA